MPPKEYSQRSASWNKVRARTVRHSARRGQRNTVALPYPACCPSMALHDQLRAHSSLRRHRLQYGYHAGGQKSTSELVGVQTFAEPAEELVLGEMDLFDPEPDRRIATRNGLMLVGDSALGATGPARRVRPCFCCWGRRVRCVPHTLHRTEDIAECKVKEGKKGENNQSAITR